MIYSRSGAPWIAQAQLKSAQKPPKGSQEAGPKSVPGGSKTAPGLTSDLRKRHEEGLISI